MAAAFATGALALGARTSALRGGGVCDTARGGGAGTGTSTGTAARARVRMAFTSIGGVLTDAPISMPCDADAVIGGALRQVLGNAHVMESERAELRDAESEFRMSGDVRELVRSIALSGTYMSRFVECNSTYRATELLFKHILARAPRDLGEYARAMRVQQTAGFRAAVDMLVDSEEYDDAFGADTVPYAVYRGTYGANEDFNRGVALRGPWAGSDKMRKAVLQYAVCSGDSPSWLTIAKGLPAGTDAGSGFSAAGRWASTSRNKKSGKRVGTKIPGGVVFY